MFKQLSFVPFDTEEAQDQINNNLKEINILVLG